MREEIVAIILLTWVTGNQLLDVTTISGTTCRGRCINKFVEHRPCQCNDQCSARNNCCPDHIAECNATCLDRCNAMYDRVQPCQCDSNCTMHKNCCPDLNYTCRGIGTPPPGLISTTDKPATCLDRCNAMYDEEQPCQCDGNCTIHNNCCPDLNNTCRERKAASIADNLGVIIGGVVGGVFLLILIVVIIIIYYRRRRRNNSQLGEKSHQQDITSSPQHHKHPPTYTDIDISSGGDGSLVSGPSVHYSTVNKRVMNMQHEPSTQTTYDHIPNRGSDFTGHNDYDHVEQSTKANASQPGPLSLNSEPESKGYYDVLDRTKHSLEETRDDTGD